MVDRLKIELPDWRRWFRQRPRHAARDAGEYDLHLAALEWSLSSALDINRLEDFQSLPSPSVEPFAHQVDDAILFFRRLAPRGLIADDVGLGKTVTAGLLARELLDRGRIESLLVVCPRSLVEQWQEELDSKFAIKAVAAVGGNFSGLNRHPFWITSYQTARRRIDAIRARKFDLLILDEAHVLRNLYGSQGPPQVATAFERLMRDDSVRYCVMLTATPIQNRLWDIFSLLEILRAPQPNPLGPPDLFRPRYIADADARRLRGGTEEEFRRKIAEATIRTRRVDTKLLFPEREVRTDRLKPLDDEREYINDALNAILGFPKLVQITHARTLMSSPWAAAAAFEREARNPNVAPADRERFVELARRGRAVATSAKIQAVVTLAKASVQDGRAGRLIVFTQRLETLEQLAGALRTEGFERDVAIMRGGDSGANVRAIRDFMAEPPSRPILLSTDTGAVGLNLQAGNIVVNYDLPWNPMLLEQRIGRVQRLGQKARHVVVHNLVLRDTIEDHVVRRLMEKLELFTQAIGEMEELLELCGYDDEGHSLEQVIMGLIRKAAERMDVEEDLRRMEESRRAAEERMREIRQATEQALASIRPRDAGVRLEGLERLTPRLPLAELIRGCLRRAGADVREEDGRLFVRSPGGYTELVFDREARLGGSDQEVRAVLPGTRAFEHLTRPVREEVAYHVVDASGVSLQKVQALLERELATAGIVVEGLSEVGARPKLAIRAAVRVSVEVATDRYETILEIDDAAEADGVGSLLGAVDELRGGDGEPLPRCRGATVQPVGDQLTEQEAGIVDRAKQHSSVERFCAFYGERYREDLERLREHARSLGHKVPDIEIEEAVESAAQRHASVRAGLASLRLRFVPLLRVEPLGVNGIRYHEVDIEVRARSRLQHEAHAVRVRGIPLTGVLLSAVPGVGDLSPGQEGWVCPGGHVVPVEKFVRCSGEACTTGACAECMGARRAAEQELRACVACDAPVCRAHSTSCRGCDRPVCERHARRLSTDGGRGCPLCVEVLADGRHVLSTEVAESAASGRRALAVEMEPSALGGGLALPGELVECEDSRRKVLPSERIVCAITGKRVASDLVERSAVSGRPGLRSAMKRSALSGRFGLPDEMQICDETGALLLPDEIDRCSLSGKRVRKDLLESDALRNVPALRRLMGQSEVSGRWTSTARVQRSDVTGRCALPDEVVTCEVCHQHPLTDEVMRCPETGRQACGQHFTTCEMTGDHVLPEGLGRCQATGRQVRRSLLVACPETGKVATPDVLEPCEVTGVRVLPEGLAASSVSGKRVRRALLVPCQATGQLALPSELAASSVSGKLVRPDVMITCPESGARLLPAEAAVCEESGALVAPGALGDCSVTGRRVKRSLLGIDDLTGRPVLARLLHTCSITGCRTVEAQLATSSVSGKRALRERMVSCEATGRSALPGELATCSVSGRAVHPDLLVTCSETGGRVLPSAAVSCEASGDLVVPAALATCEATGKRVRRSLMSSDEVTGKRVMSSLLRACERTGRRTLPENLVTSALSGVKILAEIAQRCEESGAPALPDELARCEATGKRVLPGLLERCADSGKLVLRTLLRTCEESGQRVLPEYLTRCRRSGKLMRMALMGRSELSGEDGLRGLLVSCEATGRRIFADERVTTGLTGKRVAKDRVFACLACGRRGDLDERVRCDTCEQFYCVNDCRAGMCVLCVRLLTRGGGRGLTRSEIETLKERHPWARRGWLVEARGVTLVQIEQGRFSLRRRGQLLVFEGAENWREGAGAPRLLGERTIDGGMITRAHAAG